MATRGEDAVADRIHAALHTDQIAGGDPQIYRPLTDAVCQQLPPRNDTMLVLRERADDRIYLPFPSYNVGFGWSFHHDRSVARIA